ncbi:MAG: AmmeMemoRadiSam system radical SAM enzyme [Elusimicrobia bacterium]|nr:AmmeMemoRadiSam system radical SAM enzyme [Elusimicrobiota bacterium]
MRTVTCDLCPRHCRLKEGERGDCRVRANIDGKLYSLVYGKACAAHVDPIEKKPVFHVLPGSSSFSIATAGCNLHCLYCQNWQISQRPPEETPNIDLPPASVVENARRYDCRSIAYTYTDPIVFYEYTLDTSRLAKDQGLLNILVTAGYIEQEPLKALCPFITAANVDLKGMSDDFYRRMSQGTLTPVLEAILTMKRMGVHVEITNLLVPTWNDTDKDILALIRWIKEHCGSDTPLHFSRFWPTHELQNLPPTPEETLTHAWELARAEGLSFVYAGNMPGHPGNNTFCPGCGKILIRRRGYQILSSNLAEGTCDACGSRIPGIWK